MTLSKDAVIVLKNVIYIFITHTCTNALLLSPVNALRCAFWKKRTCSTDEGWICNWLFLVHLHVSILLACMMVNADDAQTEKVAYLLSAIVMSYIMEGIFALDLLDPSLAALQCLVFGVILFVICYVTYQDPNATTLLRTRPVVRRMRSSSSLDQRQKLPIATIAIIMHMLSSVMGVIDMTFGNGRSGYKGDMSSPIYQSISSFRVSDIMVVAFIFVFAMHSCATEHHKNVLRGQAVALFFLQVMLATWQGEQMEPDMRLSASIGSFVFMLVALVGAL